MSQRTNLLLGVGVGALATYYLDPVRGRRRRAGVGEKLTHLSRTLPRKGATVARDLANRSKGILAESRHAIPFRGRELVPDPVLESRVRAALGRVVSHPHLIEVRANQGIVMLCGQIPSSERRSLLECVRQVEGVKGIENRLEGHKLEGGARRTLPKIDVFQSNWSPATRFLMGVAGGSLLAFALTQRRPLPLSALAASLGSLVLARSVTNIETKRLLGFGGRRGLRIRKTIHIAKPVDEVYSFWRKVENFRQILTEIVEVHPTSERRSYWTVRGPAGVPIHLDTELTVDVPNRLLAWRSVPGSPRHAGRVQFFEVESGGTKVELDLAYNPPAGVLGLELARILGANPKRRIELALAELKQLIEQGPSHRQARATATSH